jgi:hypothetical protein
MVDSTSTQSMGKELAPPVHRVEARIEVIATDLLSHRLRSPPTGWSRYTIN